MMIRVVRTDSSYAWRRLELEQLERRLPLTAPAFSELAGLNPMDALAVDGDTPAADLGAASSTVEALKGPGGGNGGGNGGGKGGGVGGGNPNAETAGNNLSFPVIWSDGVSKVLPGTPGMTPIVNGEWWYQWGTNGTDPNIVPASCPPDPDATDPDLNPTGLPLCDDGVAQSVDVELDVTTLSADNPLEPARAYLQKDSDNLWQAESADWSDNPVNVHWIDWGDNLESVDWTLRSQVRTEVVLFQDLLRDDGEGNLVPTDPRVGDGPWLEYEMRHTDGWGINEVHGLATSIVDPTTSEMPTPQLGPGTQATVYTHCARMTIQKLLVPREDPALDNLIWIADTPQTDGGYYVEPGTEEYPLGSLISPPMFNMPVYESGDGPGYYSAEINVKGRVIFGYTWNVRKLNEGAGDYRITFSLDDYFDPQQPEATARNTFFVPDVTDIIQPAEETEAEPTSGARAELDFVNQLTFIDVHILAKAGGGGGNSNKMADNLTLEVAALDAVAMAGHSDEGAEGDTDSLGRSTTKVSESSAGRVILDPVVIEDAVSSATAFSASEEVADELAQKIVADIPGGSSVLDALFGLLPEAI